MTVDIARGDLLELAGRVEAASGPDRELDVVIAQAIGFSVNGLTVDKLLSYSPHNTIAEIAKWASGDPTPFFVFRYTASLDAAMALVDPRALWAHGSMEEGPFARLCWPMPNGGFVGGYVEASAASVPLAICAAALRARALQESSHDRA